MYSSAVPEDKYTKKEKRADNKALAAAENQNAASASDWNDYATSFNKTLTGGLSDQADSFYNSILTSDIGDYNSLDDFDSLVSQGTALKSSLDALDVQQAPTLTNDIAGSENILLLDNLPKLKDLKTNLYEGTRSDLSGGLAALTRLRGEWENEANKVKAFNQGAASNIAQLSSMAGQLGIGDEAMMNQLNADINSELARIGSFSSPLLGTIGSVDTSGLNSALGTIADLRSQRAAEQNRIDQFETGLQTNADNFYDQYKDLTINDQSDLEGLLANLEEGMRSASRFSSELPFDLSQEGSEYQTLYSGVQGLLNERQNEQARWDAFQSGLSNQARDLERAMENSGINVYQNIDSYDNMIGDMQSDLSGYNTDLNVDRSNLDPVMSELQTALEDLKARRAAAIDPLEEQLSGFAGRISGLDLADVEGRKAVRTDLNSLIGELGTYSGGRVPGLLEQTGTHMSALDDLVSQLSDKRSGIETSGQALLDQLMEGSYTSQDAVDTAMGQYDDLMSQIDQYDATGASDEAASILDFLNGQTNRLQQEEQNRIAAQERDQSIAQSMIGNNDLMNAIMQSAGSTHLTDAQIMQLMSGLNNQDEDTKSYLLNAFSQAMGV